MSDQLDIAAAAAGVNPKWGHACQRSAHASRGAWWGWRLRVDGLGCFNTAGDQFALFEAVVALSMLMRRYDFAIDPAAPEVRR